MIKTLRVIPALVVSLSLVLSGCSGSSKITRENQSNNTTKESTTPEVTAKSSPGENVVTPKPQENVDLTKVKPNESGKIMVVMFHNFVESFTPSKYDKGEYTTTFDAFRKLLPELYEKGYRLISVGDYLSNNISVPAGCIPMIFTFDDATSGQFNLVEEGGKLVANQKTAVGIMEEFNKTHPDFGLKGTFYVNLGNKTFEGQGTLADRLKYLTDKGFDIGNHTLTHVHLNQVQTADKIQEEIGGNQKKIGELIPDYKMASLALPFGQATKTLRGYVEKGEYQGVQYQNFAIMEVGWDPAPSPVSKKFNPLSTHRVRSSGIKPVDADLEWWLKNLTRNEQYISDGNPQTVSVPKGKESNVDSGKLNGKELVVY